MPPSHAAADLKDKTSSETSNEAHANMRCMLGIIVNMVTIQEKTREKKKENPTCLAVGKPYIMRNHQSDFRDKMFSLGEVKVQGHKLTKVWTNGFGLDEWTPQEKQIGGNEF